MLSLRDKLNQLLSKLSVRQRQYLLASALIAGAGVAGIVIYQKVTDRWAPKTEKVSKEKAEKVETKVIASAVSRTDPEEMWRYKMEEERKKISEEVDEVKKVLNESIEESNSKNKDVQVQELKEEIEYLKGMIMERNNQELVAEVPSMESRSELVGIEKITFNLEANKTKHPRSVEDTIPAGAFARAVILGGVDASTTLGAPQDPRPMLVRLVDTGTLPRRFKSDLEDCHIIASTYGDLSSERVYARLEKLTCVERQTGEIIETEVAGYVAGEDGKVGIRGNVVEKGQAYLTNSIAGGILQGVAGVMMPQAGMTLNPLVGATIEKEALGDKFGRGAGMGVAGSMDRLSKYYIERAEKLQPVIQVGAGRTVDVVFTEGAQIGTQLVREQIEAKRQNKISKQSMELNGDESDSAHQFLNNGN
jgi:conjugal transfer pilus assembly protein TraB